MERNSWLRNWWKQELQYILFEHRYDLCAAGKNHTGNRYVLSIYRSTVLSTKLFGEFSYFSLVSWGRVRLGPLGTSATNWPIVPAPDGRWWWMWSRWSKENWRWKPKYSKKTCPIVTSFTINPTWPDLGSGNMEAEKHMSGQWLARPSRRKWPMLVTVFLLSEKSPVSKR
jgi:hypothetical protein